MLPESILHSGLVTLQGACWLGVNATLAYLALVAATRLSPGARCSARLSLAATLWLFTIVVVAQVLGLLGIYRWTAMAAATAALSYLARRAWPARVEIGGDLRRVALVASQLSWPGRLVAVVALAAWFRLAWRAVAQLPIGWDALTYHLPIAAGFVTRGTLATPSGPFSMDHYAHFPNQAELFVSWFMLPFHADLVAGLTSVLLLACAWLVAYALSRTLDLDESDAALAATCITTSPFLYGFAAGANNDLFVCTMGLASVLFLVRWLDARHPADGAALCMAAGLAVGAKYTALPLAALVLLVALGAAVRADEATRRGRTRAVQLGIALGLLLAGGGRPYISNLASTGNPVYPLALRVAGHDLVPTSPYTDWLVERLGGGTRADDRFPISTMFHYYPNWKPATSGGPKYALLLLAALLAAVAARDYTAPRVRLLVIAMLLVLVAAVAPSTGFPALSRRFWPTGLARMVGVALALSAVAAFTLLRRLDARTAMVVRVGVVAASGWDLFASFTAWQLTPALPITLALGAATLVALTRAPRWSHAVWMRGVAVAGLAAVVAVPMVERYRAGVTWTDMVGVTDADDVEQAMKPGWDTLYDAPPQRVALTVNESRNGQGAFPYPLMGRRLQHEVFYVPVSADTNPAPPAYIQREDPDEAQWLRAIEQAGTTWVVTQDPWPIEDAWMDDRPTQFVREFGDRALRLYRVVR